MNAYEIVALNEYLYAYPTDKTYDEVLDMLLKRDDEVLVWDAFEYKHPQNIYEFINNLKDVLEENFIPREEVL